MKKLVFGLALLVSASVFAASPQDKCLQNSFCSQGNFYGVFVSSATAYQAAGVVGTSVTVTPPSGLSTCITDIVPGIASGQTVYAGDLTAGTTFFQLTQSQMGSTVVPWHRESKGPVCLPASDKFIITVSSGAASAGTISYDGWYSAVPAQ